MKPDVESKEDENIPVTGDVIGNTAYSERFVLKILLKLANLDSLKDEISETSFEEDLCTLWDMTTDKDVVSFLQKHDVLKLFNFALPIIESPRIVEIIVGVVGNMCCEKDAVSTLMTMEDFLKCLLEYIKTDDSLILIQLLRLVNSAIFQADDENICKWMDLFENVEYSVALYFILKNSSNKTLLATALENLNTISTYCNIDKTRINFFTNFVTLDALESLTTAFTEVVVTQKESYEREELERVLVISLQIILNMVGFEKSLEIFCPCKESVIKMINQILLYYEDKLVNQKEIDSDLVDIIDSTNTITRILQLSEECEMENYFTPCYSMWKALNTATKCHQNGNSDFEDSSEELALFSRQLKLPICTLLCDYMLKCSENKLLFVMDALNGDYENIVVEVASKEIQDNVSKRTSKYRTRLKESVDS